MSTSPPSNESTNYNPNSIGTRPAFGWYLRYADNIRFNNSSVRFAANDGRPAVLVNNSTRIGFTDFVAQRGSGSPFDVGFQSATGQCASNARNTTGGALRYDPSAAPPSCTPTSVTRYEAENGTISQGTVDADHAGYSGTGFVNYTNVAGGYVQWSVDAGQTGTATLSFRYANGTTANRPLDIAVNGVVVRAGLAFPGTGAWTNWQTVTTTVPLTAGANTIRATATTADGGPNTDFLEVS